jgi:hypothetical protein
MARKFNQSQFRSAVAWHCSSFLKFIRYSKYTQRSMHSCSGNKLFSIRSLMLISSAHSHRNMKKSLLVKLPASRIIHCLNIHLDKSTCLPSTTTSWFSSLKTSVLNGIRNLKTEIYLILSAPRGDCLWFMLDMKWCINIHGDPRP